MNQHNASQWLSDPRFASFLAQAGGNHNTAVALHEWHAQMAGSCLATLHHFEVLLRNAIDRRLGAGQPNVPVTSTWLLDPKVLRPQGINRVQEILRRLDKEHLPRERARVVAGLSFAFWKDLFAGPYDPLWVADLRHAFPGASLRREVLMPLGRIHLWRNRVAHHDSLLGQKLDLRFVDVVQVGHFIDPAAAGWLKSTSTMLDVLAKRPV